jgi:hypothetical protein
MVKNIYQRLKNIGVVHEPNTHITCAQNFGSYIAAANPGEKDEFGPENKYFYFEESKFERTGRIGRNNAFLIDDANGNDDEFLFAYIYINKQTNND